jgi:hypothetical protein
MPNDFSLWINRIKANAKDVSIFEYIDPDVNSLLKPTKPKELVLADFWIAENYYNIILDTMPI